MLDCNDQIKDKIPENASEDQITRYTGEFERCAVKCVESSLTALPGLFKTMKSVLSSRIHDV